MMSLVTLQSVAEGVLRASWQASVLAVVVLAIQAMLGRCISARVRYGLWSLVLIRLALPFNLPSPVSVHNFYPRPVPQVASVAPVTVHQLPAMPTVEPRPAKKADAPMPSAMSWSQRLVIAWAIGCGASVALVLVASIRLSRHVRRQQLLQDARVLGLLRSCAKELRLRRLPILLTGPNAGGPALVGFVRPRLLLPEAVLGFEDEALRLILLHELAHQKRLDVPANWTLALLQAVHWFNPVVHLVFARIRADRELACDERVLSLTQPADRPSYGRTIVRLIESLSNAPRVPAPAVGILAGRRQLRRRITMIAEHRPVRRTWSLVALVATSLVAAVACTDAVRGGEKSVPAIPGADPGVTRRASGSPSVRHTPGGETTVTADRIEVDPALGGAAPGFAPADDRLVKRVPEVKLDAIPMSDALNFIRDVSKVNLFVDRKALEAAGVELDSPVTLDLKDITLEQAFRLIGRSAAPTGVELGATVDGDVVIFGVLVQPAPPAAMPGQAGPSPDDMAPMGFAAPQPGREQRAATERAVTRVYDVEKLTHGDSAQLQNLVQVVMTTSKPGKSSVLVAVQPFNGKLVMTATPDLHDQVQELLGMLQDTAPAKPTATKPTPSPKGVTEDPNKIQF